MSSALRNDLVDTAVRGGSAVSAEAPARLAEAVQSPLRPPRGFWQALATPVRISVVVPVNNEKANVEPLLRELHEVLLSIGDHEIVVVDDGSTDATAEEVKRIGRETGAVRLLRHATRRGQSTAIYNGVRAATSDIVVTMDGDLQNDPRDIPVLLERFVTSHRDALGLVIGHRTQRRDSIVRRVSSLVANAIRSRALDDATPDAGCGIKIFRRSVFLQLPYFDHMHRFLPALMLRAGYAVESAPVRHRPRIHHEAHYGVWGRAVAGLIDLVGVAWLVRRTRPLPFQEERL